MGCMSTALLFCVKQGVPVRVHNDVIPSNMTNTVMNKLEKDNYVLLNIRVRPGELSHRMSLVLGMYVSMKMKN